jgi:hypothetical protein
MSKYLRVAVVLALLLAACRAEINLGFDINDEGGGTFAMEVGLDEEMKNLASMGSEGADPFEEMLGEIGTGDLEGAEVTRYTEGDMEYARWSVGFDNIEGLPADVFAPDDPENPFRELKIETTDDGVRFEMTIEMPDATEDAGDAFDPSLLTEDIFAFNVRAKLPGSVDDHNADKVLSDGTLQWALPITGGTVDAFAESSSGGGGIPILVIVLVAVGVLAVLGVVIMARRGDSGQPAFEAAGPAQAWETPEAPAPPPADPYAGGDAAPGPPEPPPPPPQG